MAISEELFDENASAGVTSYESPAKSAPYRNDYHGFQTRSLDMAIQAKEKTLKTMEDTLMYLKDKQMDERRVKKLMGNVDYIKGLIKDLKNEVKKKEERN